MRRFAALLDRLSFQPQRNAKLRLLEDYFRHTPDPDRGYALAALTGQLAFRHAKPALIRNLVWERVDPVLFELSYDYVGDMAETIALIWPVEPEGSTVPGSVTEVIDGLNHAGKTEQPGLIAGWLDGLDATGRWALIKLITGGLRVGVSERLAKVALANLGQMPIAEIEEVWPVLAPPYAGLFHWLTLGGPRPSAAGHASFRPVMLAHAIEEADFAKLDPADYLAEWKWDGIRVQIVGEAGRARLYARSGEEITHTFPDLLQDIDFSATLDGELLVMRDGRVAPFADLQKRLNRKTISAALLRESPVGVRLYDILFDGSEDLRPLGFAERRTRLEDWIARNPRPRLDLSTLVPFATWDELAEQRNDTAQTGVEGLMLKRKDSPYVAGRPKGLWWKWKRDPHLIDAVLLYAQRGHGKRSSFYSDYTFGVWRDEEIVPVGKAYFGFTDEELLQLDRWVRNHTINRFGPVREVERALVLEVAFEGIQRSTRHRSGLAMRFPRISRIRWDKPACDADRLETLEKLARDTEDLPQTANLA